MLTLRFLHFIGIALWIGGAISAFVLARAVSNRPPAFKVSIWPLLARVHGIVIAPGALLTVISGLLLTLRLTHETIGTLGTGIIVMQATGIVAAVLAVFVGLPTANQLALYDKLDTVTELPPEAVALRKRQAIASSVAGVLALVSMYFGAVVR